MFEKITNEFYQEQAVEERVSVETIENRFYIDFIKQFLCYLPTILFKFLIGRGVGHTVEHRPSLVEPPSNTNWAEKLKAWDKLISMREWKYLLNK